jgi:hypothetical protein
MTPVRPEYDILRSKGLANTYRNSLLTDGQVNGTFDFIRRVNPRSWALPFLDSADHSIERTA